MSLGEVATNSEGKEDGEPKAALKLLESLTLKRVTVTVDAGGESLFAVKKNQMK